MSRVFFLLNRCFQVAKLCSATVAATVDPTADGTTVFTAGATAGALFPYPPLKARSRLPAELNRLYGLLDRMCGIAALDAAEEPYAGDNGSASGNACGIMPTELNQLQRDELEEFERLIVALRFSSDESIKSPAVALLRAIFADAHYFSGLKPLPQYTEAFAYELLFPSWLNLLSAVMLPRADNGKSRLEGSRQGLLFEFLGAVDQLTAEDQRLLVGYMTFIASRFDAPACEDLLQRLVDLVLQHGASTVNALDEIDLACKDARQLKHAVADYLVVSFSLSDSSSSPYAVAYQRPLRRPLPEILVVTLKTLAESSRWTEFLSLAGPLRAIIQSKHSLAPEMVSQLTQRPASLGELLGLIAMGTPSGRCVLSEQAQVAVAALIAQQPDLLDEHIDRLQIFCRDIAPHLAGFSDAALDCFHQLLIADQAGRQQLLSALHSHASRTSVIEQLQHRAAKSDNDSRWLSLLSCASILWSDESSGEARASLQALDAVVSNRTIGDNELSDLLTDLRAEPQAALARLASPMMAAAGKSPRVAALYLTLNEVSQKLSGTGAVDNFSVVRAKYSRLTNMGVD